VKVIPFRELPKGARHLIIYYAIAEPGVVGFAIFNAYLLLLGYSPIYVGSIISGASLITALLLPLLGYLSDRRINAKYYLMTIEALLGLAFLLYGFAQNAWWIFLGRMVFSSAMLFSFTSSVYEKELYPEDKLDDAYIWHWLIPSVAGIITYAAAFIYFSLFPDVQAARICYILLGALSPVFVSYVYFALPDLPTYRKRERVKIRREMWGIIGVFISAYLATYFLYGIAVDNIIINYFGAGIAIVVLLALIDSIAGFSSSFVKGNLHRRYFSAIPYFAMASLGILAFSLFALHIMRLDSIATFLLFYSAIAFMWPLWHMSFKPKLLEAVPRELRGTVFSGVQSITRILNIPLAFLVGLTVTMFGAFSPLLISAVFSLLTVILLRGATGKRKRIIL